MDKRTKSQIQFNNNKYIYIKSSLKKNGKIIMKKKLIFQIKMYI